jgi:hypothetical protein
MHEASPSLLVKNLLQLGFLRVRNPLMTDRRNAFRATPALPVQSFQRQHRMVQPLHGGPGLLQLRSQDCYHVDLSHLG